VVLVNKVTELFDELAKSEEKGEDIFGELKAPSPNLSLEGRGVR
jgi:hypothetical protein